MYKVTSINIEYRFSNEILHMYKQITDIVVTIS